MPLMVQMSMIRGYDTSALFREDTILRIQHLNEEIAALQRSMEEVEEDTAASEDRKLDYYRSISPLAHARAAVSASCCVLKP